MGFGKLFLIFIWYFIVGIINDDDDFAIGVFMFVVGALYIYKY